MPTLIPQQQMVEQDDQNVPPYIVQKDNKADLLDKIRPSDIVDDFRHYFRGERKINGVWTLVSPHDALTEEGANMFASMMLPLSSQNIAISNLTERDIRMLTAAVVKDAMRIALRNWKSYGITGKHQFYFIKSVIMNNTYVTSKQAENAGGRRLVMGTQLEMRSFQNVETQKAGFWGNFLKFKRP
jgi:hypothetical protein